MITKSIIRFGRSAEWIPAMREVQRIVRETKFSNDSFAMSLAYINWETDAIVGIELIRNIGIALACIFVTTLVTLGSWRGSLLVMMCVLLTCTDVAGFMHWWGLTIDITSMNVLIIRWVCIIYYLPKLQLSNLHLFLVLVYVLTFVLTLSMDSSLDMELKVRKYIL